MPSTSKKQRNFMAAVAHNPSFAKKVGVPQSVGKDFSNADKGKTFKRGGEMATKMDPKMMAMMAAKKRGMGGAGARPSAPPPAPPMPPMGGGMGMGMKKGGMAMVMKDGKKVPSFAADGEGKMKHGGSVKKMSSGGSASSRADGIAQRGKTKGTMLKKGGMAC